MSNPHAVLGRERQVALVKLLLETVEGGREAPDVAARTLVYMFEAVSRLNGRPAKHFALEAVEFSENRSLVERGLEAVGNPVDSFGPWRRIWADREVYFARDRQRALAVCLVSALEVSGFGKEASMRIARRFAGLFERFNCDNAAAFLAKLEDSLAEADFEAPPRDLEAA